jgi:hypothetical protein
MPMLIKTSRSPNTRAAWLKLVLVLLACLAARPAVAQSTLVYFLLDTSRPPEQRLLDSRDIKAIVDLIRAERPDLRIYYQLTGIKSPLDATFDDGRPTIQIQALQGYNEPEKLPARFRESRDLADELALMSRNVFQLKQQQKVTSDAAIWVIAFDDFDFIDHSVNVDTSCCALADGWLKVAKSPFVTKLLRNDNSALVGSGAIVFLSRPRPLVIRRNKEVFAAQLFNELGGRTYYLGYNYVFGQSSQTGFSTSLIAQWMHGKLAPLPFGPIPDAALLQVIDDSGKPISINAYN